MKSLIRFSAVLACCFAATSLTAERRPTNRAVGENKATPPGRIKAAPGFEVELLYSVPGEAQGSWVNLCTDPKGRIIASDQYGGLLALTCVTGIDPQHRKPSDPPVDKAMQAKILDALTKLDWKKLNHEQRLTVVRIYEICFVRFGRPDDSATRRILAQLDPQFPAATREMNWLLCETLVYLQSPTVAAKAVALLKNAPTQEEQMEYARSGC